jgi:galactose mutarotase-like enzyme
MQAEIFQTTEQGFAVVGLRGPTAELAMVPELGGRVISLRSRRSGREWCWHRPDAAWLWRSEPGSDFGASPQAGIDECVPSVAACTWRGRAVPDHGEVWFQSWQLDDAERAAGRLTATVALPITPLRFRRAISATEHGFRFDYTLTNLGAAPEEYVWCVHPLFTIEADDRMELPAEVRALRVNGGIGTQPIAQGDLWNYPEPQAGFRLDRLETPGMPRGCIKGFAGPLSEGAAALANDRTGDRLELRWDVRAAPLLGLWLNRGHAGFHHVALEPTNGAPDSLAQAVDGWRQFSTLAPGETREWWLEWRVS